jgi:hypothetical protein
MALKMGVAWHAPMPKRFDAGKCSCKKLENKSVCSS